MIHIKQKEAQNGQRAFILASQSPQRREILDKLGIQFEVIPSDFDESTITECDPAKRAELLAEAKAKEVAAKHPDRWVIGVDTLVVSEDGQLLEKPIDADDARRMLKLHSGRTSVVHSGICLISQKSKGKSQKRHISSAYVTFRDLTDEIIEDWVQSDLWQERSGAFQIELPNVRSSEEIENHPLICGLNGEFETVVGFPIKSFEEIIRQIHR